MCSRFDENFLWRHLTNDCFIFKCSEGLNSMGNKSNVMRLRLNHLHDLAVLFIFHAMCALEAKIKGLNALKKTALLFIFCNSTVSQGHPECFVLI